MIQIFFLARSGRTHAQQVQRTAIHGLAQLLHHGFAGHLRMAQRLQMALKRIRLKVGVIHRIALRLMADGQHAIFITGGHGKPLHAVVRGARRVISPAARIR